MYSMTKIGLGLDLIEEGELNGCVGVRCVGTMPSCVIRAVAVGDTAEISIYWEIVIGSRHKSFGCMQSSDDFAHMG